MKNNDRVLMLMSSFPLVEYEGGNGVNFYRLAKAMVANNCKVDVIAPSHHSIDDFQLMSGIKVYRFRYWFNKHSQKLSYGHGFMKNLNDYTLAKVQVLPWFISYYFKCKSLIKKKKYIAIHANFLNTALVSTLLPRNIKKLYSVRNPGLVDTKSPFKIKLMQYVFNRVDQVVVNSTESKNKLLKKHSNLEKKINVVCGGVDDIELNKDDRSFIRNKYKIPKGGRIIISVGRLARIKNFDYLIKSFKNISKNIKNLFLVIIGSGPEKEYLENLTEGDKKIKLLGRINNLEVIQWYNASDFFVLTSSGDTGPIVLLEALRAGLPIISTKVGYALDFIENGENGYFINKRDEQDLTKKLNKILNLSETRLHKMSIYTKNLFSNSNSYSHNSACSYYSLYKC